MTELRERRVQLGPVGFTVRMPAERADRLKKTLWYRKLVRPSLDAMARFSNGRQEEAGAPALEFPAEAEDTTEARQLWGEIISIDWYHTVQMPFGLSTPGNFDHRTVLKHYKLPDDMHGMRVLDVATLDGFWAFEFERRGAAEVIGIDVGSWAELDLPPALLEPFIEAGADRKTGLGFEIAKRALGSGVRRVERSVYDLSPENLGMFDFVFSSDLLLHLHSPMMALHRIRSVTKRIALIADVFNPTVEKKTGEKYLSRYLGGWKNCVWWIPDRHCLKEMIRSAGFSKVEELSRFRLAERGEDNVWRAVFRAEV